MTYVARERQLMLSSQKYEVIRSLSDAPGRKIMLVRNSVRDSQSILKSIPITPFMEGSITCEPKVQLFCSHPNVVQVFHHEVFKNHLFVEMEYAKNGSLFDIIVRRFLSATEAVDYMKKILVGLDVVHQLGLVHRDVGAENIMIFDDTAKLSDFGSVLDVRTGRMVSEYVYAPYAPPEIVKHQDFLPSSDVYTVGLTLLRLVNNQAQFHVLMTGVRNHIQNTEDVEGSVEDFIPVKPHVPDSLRRIIRKALSLKMSNRYQTAKEMADDLEKLRPVRNWSRIDKAHWRCLFRGKQETIEVCPGLVPRVRHRIAGSIVKEKVFPNRDRMERYIHDYVSHTTFRS